MSNGFVHRSTGQEDKPSIGRSCFDQDILLIALVRLENDSLHSILCSKTLHLQRALVQNDHRVPSSWNAVPIALFDFAKSKVDVVGRCTSEDWTPHAEYFSGNYFGNHARTVIVDWNIFGLKLLVLRLAEFVPCLKIDPQLEAERP